MEDTIEIRGHVSRIEADFRVFEMDARERLTAVEGDVKGFTEDIKDLRGSIRAANARLWGILVTGVTLLGSLSVSYIMRLVGGG